MPIMSGVATTTSKSNQFSLVIFATRSISRRHSRRRRPWLASALASLANTRTRTGLTGAVGQNDGAADLLVSVTGVNAQTDVDLNGLVELGLSSLHDQIAGLRRHHTER